MGLKEMLKERARDFRVKGLASIAGSLDILLEIARIRVRIRAYAPIAAIGGIRQGSVNTVIK